VACQRLSQAGHGGSPPGRRHLEIGQFLAAAAVAVFLHQPPRLGERSTVVEEAGAVEANFGEKKRHRPALGDLLRLVEIGAGAVGIAKRRAQPGAGEEALRQLIATPGAAEAVDGLLDLGLRAVERRAFEERGKKPSAASSRSRPTSSPLTRGKRVGLTRRSRYAACIGQ
jgi:hypothetical protein